jgi:hypothetical protein
MKVSNFGRRLAGFGGMAAGASMWLAQRAEGPSQRNGAVELPMAGTGELLPPGTSAGATRQARSASHIER